MRAFEFEADALRVLFDPLIGGIAASFQEIAIDLQDLRRLGLREDMLN
jgi:hypothetical protein